MKYALGFLLIIANMGFVLALFSDAGKDLIVNSVSLFLMGSILPFVMVWAYAAPLIGTLSGVCLVAINSKRFYWLLIVAAVLYLLCWINSYGATLFAIHIFIAGLLYIADYLHGQSDLESTNQGNSSGDA